MTRSVKEIEEITYEVTRLEILEDIRDLISRRYAGGALVTDKRNQKQRCEFIGANGVVLQVEALRITTTYEKEQAADAVARCSGVGTV